jgi:hypothetical protein
MRDQAIGRRFDDIAHLVQTVALLGLGILSRPLDAGTRGLETTTLSLWLSRFESVVNRARAHGHCVGLPTA